MTPSVLFHLYCHHIMHRPLRTKKKHKIKLLRLFTDPNKTELVATMSQMQSTMFAPMATESATMHTSLANQNGRTAPAISSTTAVRANNNNNNKVIGHSQALRNHLIARTPIKVSSSAAATNSTVRSHKGDSPMLNYIFDSHLASNKHHHRSR